MNRILFIIMVWLSSLSVFSQTDGYNPANPPLPDFPTADTTVYHTLKVIPSPVANNVLNTNGGKYIAGTSVYLNAYDSNYMVFQYWIDDEGTTLSTSRWFNYTMPNRDATVTAVFKYLPDNPSLPDFPEEGITKYMLKVIAKPAGAGSFNVSNTKFAENESIHLYAYTNSNFRFLYWADAKGDTVSTAQNFFFTMPAADTQLYGIYMYDPANPQNPGKNAYDSFTGEVVIDDFKPGNLGSAISEVTKNNTSNITKITVAGRINNNDFSIANYYGTCSIVDLSRTTGVTTVPSYCYNGNTHLSRLLLPACISSIESRAFNNANALSELTCLSAVPPTLGNYVFNGVTKGLTVYVPSSSVELYEKAEQWKKYVEDSTLIIMPVQSNVASLEINLPEECKDGRYKNMTLELVNVKSGQKYRYVVTDRINYTFNTLMRDTRYVATLKNLSGVVLARTDTIKMDNENQSVAFELDKMKQLRDVALKVMAAGSNVTGQCSVIWYDANGNFLSQEKTLAGQVSETSVKCAVTLPQELAMQYVIPTDTLYEVVEVDNELTVSLNALPQLTIKGKVIDRTLQQVISGATVTISQTLNGKYNKSTTVKTDAKGEYTLNVFAVPSTLTYAFADYVSQIIELSHEDLSTPEAMLADVLLKPITGVTITTNFSYTTSVAETVKAEVQNYYSDHVNVAYTIFNETARKPITQFNVQYPSIVLMDEVAEGDSLTIVASSKNSAFMDVTTGGRVGEDGRMTVNIPVVQLGGIRAVYTTTENVSVLGILYDANGNFVSKYNYTSSALEIKNLKDGDYTLVSMGESDFFGSIYNLEQFSQAGIVNAVDYVANKVSVKSGVIIPVKNSVVPFFDESKFYYTGNNTSFSVNKPSIVVGNYLTLTAMVGFKSVYRDNVGNVKLKVELPEGVSFVDNSVMVGSSVAFYEKNGRTLTIPVDNNTTSNRIRFCIIPTESGNYAPSAAVTFILNDKAIEQPIGSAQYTVRDLAINVPEETNTTDIIVSGVAAGSSDITLYADNEVVGTARALANGYWTVNAELPKPYNLQTFNIYAKAVTKNGLEVQTNTKKCIYNKDKIVAKTVDMSFYNGWLRKNISLTFDLEKKTTSDNSYMFYTGTDITFAASLNSNDTTKVKSVTIRVYTDRNQWFNLPATYNGQLNKWVAVKRFESNNLPVGVKVNIVANIQPVIDFREISEVVSNFVRLQSDFKSMKHDAQMLFDEIEGIERQDNPDWDTLAILNGRLAEALGISPVNDGENGMMSNEEYLAFWQKYESFLNNPMMNVFDKLMDTGMNDLKDCADYLNGLTFTSANGLNASSLVASGYVPVLKSDGNYSYLKASQKLFGFVDFEINVAITVDLTKVDSDILASMNPGTAESFETLMNAYKDGMSKNVEKAREAIAAFCKVTDELFKAVGETYQSTVEMWNVVENYYNALNNLKKTGQLTADLQANYNGVEIMRRYFTERIFYLGKARTFLASAKIGKFLDSSSSLFNVFGMYVKWIDDIDDYMELYKSIPYCETSKEDDNMRETIKAFIDNYMGYGIVTLMSDIVSVNSATSAMGAIYNTQGASATVAVVALVKVGLNWAVSKVYEVQGTELKNKVAEFLRTFKCNGIIIGSKPDDDEPPYPQVTPIHDPSGFVYEGVSSNRLAGVTATCYYKETVEDMYGDLHENVVLWNAEEYAQKNPLFTDENGMYQWDVPQGLWQVKFEKEGYASTQSEWLPVPPPQMDVNIAMVQNSQPEVVSARAYEDGVEIEFSKYMNIESLNKYNVYLKVVKGNEETLVADATIEMLNKEVAIEGSEVHYASKMRLVTDKLGFYDEAYVIVSKNVSSYAGINMADDYQQKLDVEKKVREIVVDQTLNVAYGKDLTVNIAAQPADAAAGKKILVASASEQIATVDATEIVLDSDGHATFSVKGELLGATALKYTLEDNGMEASSMVNVVDPALLVAVKAPHASRISGTAVYRGATVALATESEGATIYYTTDGSCPCDAATRIKYERPIVINGPVTVKAMAVGVTADESDVVEFAYTIRQSDLKLNLSEGWNWSSHDLAEPIAVSELEGLVTRILTQTHEAVKDEQYGFVGNLQSVDATETMKLVATAAAEKSFSGELYNPTATQISLHKGWNWLGYPLSTTLTLVDALSILDAEEGDCIENLEGGFATYSDGEWTGDLKTLEPGHGYLYKSASDKSFAYNAVSSVANAKALYGHRLEITPAPCRVDKHQYPNMMPMVATLEDGDGFNAENGYFVVAVSGNECRGVGKIEDGMIYLSVYGEGNEAICFVAVDAKTGDRYGIKETVAFVSDMIGTVKAPYVFHIGEATGIDSFVDSMFTTDAVYGINGVRVKNARQPGVYIMKTKDSNGMFKMRKHIVR